MSKESYSIESQNSRKRKILSNNNLQKPIDITIMNASGCHCKTKEQLDELIEIGMKTVITKTCTLLPQKGNISPVFLEINEHISLNCMGMPNLGYSYYRDLYLQYKLKEITYIISMDASNEEHLLKMLEDYDAYLSRLKEEFHIPLDTLEYVEINVSCPSTKCPRIIAYDTLAFARTLENIKLLELLNIKIGLKLAPYIDKVLLKQIAELITIYQETAKIEYIVCSNSIPNGMIIDTDNSKPILSAETGGISGSLNKLISISNVYQFNKILNNTSRPHIKIIGCGGIEKLDDIKEYIAAGAHSVQIGRYLYVNGPESLKQIIQHNNISKL